MPDDVKSYFIDVNKELKKVINILLIQNKHCKIYMEEYSPKLVSICFSFGLGLNVVQTMNVVKLVQY